MGPAFISLLALYLDTSSYLAEHAIIIITMFRCFAFLIYSRANVTSFGFKGVIYWLTGVFAYTLPVRLVIDEDQWTISALFLGDYLYKQYLEQY